MIKNFRAIAILILAVFAASCGGGGSQHAIPNTAPPPGHGQTSPNAPSFVTASQALYVSNHVACPPFPCAIGSGSITTYSAAASGNAPPLTFLSGPNTNLDLPIGIAVNPQGQMFVTNERPVQDRPFALTRVTRYAAGSTGDTAPLSQFYVFPFGGAGSIAIDNQGEILLAFETDRHVTSILVYPPDTNQEFATPVRSIAGPKVSTLFAIDKSGNFYFAEGTHVEEFPPNFNGSGSPIGVFAITCKVSPIDSIAVGDDGKVYVRSSQPDVLTVFGPAVNGFGPILAEIGGPKTEPMPGAVAVDHSGTIYLAGGDRIVTYPPGANGDVAPASTITGSATHLQSASGIALGPVPPPPGPTPVPSATPSPNPNAATLYVSTLTSVFQRTSAIEAFTNGVYGAPAYAIDDPSQSQLLVVNSARTLYVSQGTVPPGGSNTVRVFPLGSTAATATITLPDLAAALAIDGNDNLYVNVRSSLLEYSAANSRTPIRVLHPRTGFHFANNPRALAVNKSLNEPVIFMVPNGCEPAEQTCTGFIERFGPTGTAPILEIPHTYGGRADADILGQGLAIDSAGEIYLTSGSNENATLGFAPGATSPSLNLPQAFDIAIGPNDNVFLEERVADSACSDLGIAGQSTTLAEFAPRSATLSQSVSLKCHVSETFSNALQVARDGTIYFGDVDHFVFAEVLIFPSLATTPISVRSGFVAERGIGVGP